MTASSVKIRHDFESLRRNAARPTNRTAEIQVQDVSVLCSRFSFGVRIQPIRIEALYGVLKIVMRARRR